MVLMKYAILADIHANLEAFKSVLEHLKGIDKHIFLGDVVGYGPDPNECIDLLKARGFISIAGNHDMVCVGKLSSELFSEEARKAIEWTSGILEPKSAEFLKGLQDHLETDDFEIVHGSLRQHLEEYITNVQEGAVTIEMMKKNLCFVGHLHIPLCIVKEKDGSYGGRQLNDGDVIDISKYEKVLINVGAVGQPRDMDNRASYGIYDSYTQKVQIFKVSYNINETQKKMRKEGLPDFLVERLKYGR